jgi:hypothetical protein
MANVGAANKATTGTVHMCVHIINMLITNVQDHQFFLTLYFHVQHEMSLFMLLTNIPGYNKIKKPSSPTKNDMTLNSISKQISLVPETDSMGQHK